ncbi:hypothetical protein LAZ67_5003296 [Cordylochernes scorpioides]|uniref:Transposase n=1 Tax=Cordylochernes scorpioides TaxID=51811 RepID=A0ABY6KH69_9ARAC|nr:hypothetical protein LAZ67_5003296 [Cordylochernes scorpioides]
MEYKHCSSCIPGLGAFTGNQSEQMDATDLALYIHSQLALCSNPRNFFGTDLVSLLERKVEKAAPGSYSPLVPLSLCNSGVELSPNHLDNIAYFLSSNSTDSFITDIAFRLKFNARIVRRIVKQYRERGHYGMLPKLGHPKTVNTSSMNRIASDFGISREGVQNIVKRKLGLRSYPLHRGQTFFEAVMKDHLDKAKKLLSKIRVGRLSDIVWTDEKIFTVEVAQNHRQLLPPGNKASRKSGVHTRLKFPKSIIVWARVISEGKTPLVFIDRNVKIYSQVYQDVIQRDFLLPWARQYLNSRNIVFGHRHVIIKPMDLNPMDSYVWSYLERNVSSSPHKSLESLKKALQREWTKIDVKYHSGVYHQTPPGLHQDMKALALLVTRCLQKTNNTLPTALNISNLSYLKSLQLADGSFRNLRSTAIIVQALMASEDKGIGWDLEKAVNFINTQQLASGSFGPELMSSYLVAPILSGQTFLNLYSQECISSWATDGSIMKMLQKAFKDDCISRSQSGKWHKAFKEGREEVADEPRSGRPTTARTDEDVDRVLEVLRTDRRLSIQKIADTLHMSTFVVHGIVTEDLQMRKVCAKIVDLIQNEPDFLNSVVTGDESWMFEYDPESKRQSCAWHTKSSLRPKKARMSKSRIKTMIIVFFDIRGIVHCEFVPRGKAVNSAFYLEVLRRLKRRIARVRTDIKDTVKLHHDNATSHTAFIITNFLAQSNTPVIPHPPYSPDLAPCDYFFVS